MYAVERDIVLTSVMNKLDIFQNKARLQLLLKRHNQPLQLLLPVQSDQSLATCATSLVT